MYFIAIKHPFYEWKPISRMVFPTKREAVERANELNRTKFGEFKAIDADHEPGRQILKLAGPGA